MVYENKRPDVAVFIDFENVYVSVRDKLDANPNFESIMDRCNELGRVVIARAYADWYRYPRVTSALYANGIEPMYVPTYYYDKEMGRTGRAIKNSVDMNLCIDAMRTLFTNTSISRFVLATGDRDFIPLVNSIRQQGKEVIIIGIGGAASTHLAQSADEFVFYEQLVGKPTTPPNRTRQSHANQRRAAAESAAAPQEAKAAPATPHEEPDVYDVLVDAVHLVRERGYVSTLGSLKLVMKELMGGDFKESRYRDVNGRPFAKFKDFVMDAERRSKVIIFTSGTVNEVFLPGEDPYKLSQFAADLKEDSAEDLADTSIHSNNGRGANNRDGVEQTSEPSTSSASRRRRRRSRNQRHKEARAEAAAEETPSAETQDAVDAQPDAEAQAETELVAGANFEELVEAQLTGIEPEPEAATSEAEGEPVTAEAEAVTAEQLPLEEASALDVEPAEALPEPLPEGVQQPAEPALLEQPGAVEPVIDEPIVAHDETSDVQDESIVAEEETPAAEEIMNANEVEATAEALVESAEGDTDALVNIDEALSLATPAEEPATAEEPAPATPEAEEPAAAEAAMPEATPKAEPALAPPATSAEELSPEEQINFSDEEWQVFTTMMADFTKPVSFANIFDSLRERRKQEQLTRTNEQLRTMIKQAIAKDLLARHGRGKRVYYTLASSEEE